MRILGAATAAALLVLTTACSTTTGEPSSGTPSSGTPSSGTPSSGTPSSGTPSSGTPSSTTPAPAAASAAELTCTGSVTTGALPTWARTGFTPPDQPVAHVIGDKGEIVGVVIGHPLHSPPQPGRSNTILWVASPGPTAKDGDSLGTELAVSARLNGVGTVARTSVAGGPGPSVIDLPAPGCWTVTLTWSGRTDTVALPYLA